MTKQDHETRRRILTKLAPRMSKQEGKLTKWRVTKAMDDKDGDYYIRATDGDGSDYPVAVTRHGDEKKNAEFIVLACNHHAKLVQALEHAMLALDSGSSETLRTAQEEAAKALTEIAAEQACDIPEAIPEAIRLKMGVCKHGQPLVSIYPCRDCQYDRAAKGDS